MRNKVILKDISLAGLLTGLICFLNIIFNFFPILFGYSINLYFVVFAVGLIIIKNKGINFFFFLFMPLILMIYPDYSKTFFKTIGQFILEYIITVWCFFPFLFGGAMIKKMELKKIDKNIIFFIFLSIFVFCWFLKLAIHIIAGRIWWTDSWTVSVIINLPIILSNLIITIPVFSLIFNRIIKIGKTYYLNNWN